MKNSEISLSSIHSACVEKDNEYLSKLRYGKTSKFSENLMISAVDCENYYFVKILIDKKVNIPEQLRNNIVIKNYIGPLTKDQEIEIDNVDLEDCKKVREIVNKYATKFSITYLYGSIEDYLIDNILLDPKDTHIETLTYLGQKIKKNGKTPKQRSGILFKFLLPIYGYIDIFKIVNFETEHKNDFKNKNVLIKKECITERHELIYLMQYGLISEIDFYEVRNKKEWFDLIYQHQAKRDKNYLDFFIVVFLLAIYFFNEKLA